MKITKALLLSAAVFAAACSDDDDNNKKSSLENAKLSFSANQDVIEAPAGLKNSDNEYALMAASFVEMANGLTNYVGFLEAPQGAKKSSSRITAANGRSKETGDVLVYTWSDDQGNTVGYQISEEANKYVFEIFFKETGSDWLKYFHVEETKDGKEGLMKIYDFQGDNKSKVVFQYTWTRANGFLTLTFTDNESDSSLVITVNETTGAGSVETYQEGVKTYKIAWDAEGNGSWAYYEDGEVAEDGEWEA